MAIILLFALVFSASGANLGWTIALTLPLAARRRLPALSAATIFTVALAYLINLVVGWGSGQSATPELGYLMVLVSLYSVTVHGPRWAYRTAATGSVVGAAIVTVATTLASGLLSAGIVGGAIVALSAMAVFAFALVRRSRLEQTDALTERARRLEAERDQQVTLGAAAERARIAREMHDIVAHSLSVIIAQADGGRYAARQDPAAASLALTTIAETGRAALADTRQLLGVLRTDSPGGSDPDSTDLPPGGLHPAELRPQPATEQISELVEQMRTSGLPVSLVRLGESRVLPPGTGLAIYRICQEALTNVLKHGGPRANATVLLKWGPADLTLEVSDDGRGAAARDDGLGGGVLGMRERATMLGGTLNVGPRPGGGFRVRAQIPLPTSAPVPLADDGAGTVPPDTALPPEGT